MLREHIIMLCMLYVLRFIRGQSLVAFYFKFWFVRLLALRPLLAYCASLGWQWRWLWRSRRNVDWQGKKPKFLEKTCPSATFIHHKIPHDQTRVWTRAAAVGSRRVTAWDCPSVRCVFAPNAVCINTDKKKVKAIPVTGHEGPYGCETSSLPDLYRQWGLTYDSQFVGLKRRPPFTPRKIPGTNFC
jgi:hypothetical protein